MNEPKAFEAPGSSGMKNALSDPLALATKPPIIFKFASAVSIYHCQMMKSEKSTKFEKLIDALNSVSFYHWSSIPAFPRPGMMDVVCSIDTTAFADSARWHLSVL